jgi:plasmid stabilization system protein ParE
MAVLFRPEAREDIVQARDWYEERAAGLGREFLRALEVAVARAQRSPEAFPLIEGRFRRVPLRRFPHFLVYQCDRRGVTVLACFHHRPDPGALARRLDD